MFVSVSLHLQGMLGSFWQWYRSISCPPTLWWPVPSTFSVAFWTLLTDGLLESSTRARCLVPFWTWSQTGQPAIVPGLVWSYNTAWPLWVGVYVWTHREMLCQLYSVRLPPLALKCVVGGPHITLKYYRIDCGLVSRLLLVGGEKGLGSRPAMGVLQHPVY